jgi:ribosomal protein S18 acetylase RimI-like enzyme
VNPIEVKPLTPDLGAAFLRFFDHERGAAFADNPEWAKCYCHFYNVPRAIDWPSLSGPQNRIAMRARVDVGATDGFLAFDGAEVVGWLNAQPRHQLPHCFERMRIEATALPCESFEAAVIVCFVVAPQRRRQGISRALLAASLTSFMARGLKVVDAFPFKSEASTLAADHYHGSLSLFLNHGFSVLREDETLTAVRKVLR